MVKYQFQADDDEWREWKETVPRSQSLEERINELIRADRDGRVIEAGNDGDDSADADPTREEPASSDETPTPNAPKTPLHEPEMAVAWTREHAPASRAEIVAACYDDEAVSVSADTWWRKRARPALEEAGLEFTRNRGWE